MGLAPAWAIPLALKRAGLTPDRVDVCEVHEEFSAQALGVLRELSNQLGGFTIPDDNLSPNGEAVATGHPFGASGPGFGEALQQLQLPSLWTPCWELFFRGCPG